MKNGKGRNPPGITHFETQIVYKMLNINNIDFLLIRQGRVVFFKILDTV